MPWKMADVEQHAKGLSDKQKKVWIKIANAALMRCQSDGGKDCEASAIRQATAIAKRATESVDLADRLHRLTEAGRVLSAGNEAAIRQAVSSLQAVLAKIAKGEEVDPVEAETVVSEARGLVESEANDAEPERAIRQALEVRLPGRSCWVRETSDSHVIYEHDDPEGAGARLYRADYTRAYDGTVTLGEPTEVRVETSYVPVSVPAPASEAHEVTVEGDAIPLVEKAVRRDGTVPIKVISAGWGSSGYYPADVLKRDGPKVFARGTHMYTDHPSVSEDTDRPERSVRDLAGVLETDAYWQEAGPSGAGLYADAKVMPHFAEHLEALAPHIGVSIRANGRAKAGEAEGRKGPVIESLDSALSIDYVTRAGAGGKVLQLLEAARGSAVTVQGGNQVDENEARQLREAAATAQTELSEARSQLGELRTDLGRLREAMILRDAGELVRSELARIEMPDMTRTRLAEVLATNPPAKDGALDRETLATRVRESTTSELEYLAKVAGLGNGAIRGVGSTDGATELSAEEAHRATEAAFSRLLGSEVSGKLAANGRA